MKKTAIVLGVLATLILLAMWTRPAATQHAETHAHGAVEARPLELLMVELGQDMQRINEGIWRDDYVMIERGARAVADHPQIPPDQIQAIRQELGAQFESFRQLDVLVHDRATEIAEAAAGGNMNKVLSLYGDVQQGCVSCHAGFRDRARTALYGQPSKE